MKCEGRGDYHKQVYDKKPIVQVDYCFLVDEALESSLRAAVAGETRDQSLDLFGPPHRVLAIHTEPVATGGAIATMVDLTCALAAVRSTTFDPMVESLVTADMHVRYVGRPRTDHVVARAEVVRSGSQLIVVDCKVRDEDGHVIAFDAAATPDGGAALVYRDDDTPSGACPPSAASVAAARFCAASAFTASDCAVSSKSNEPMSARGPSISNWGFAKASSSSK